MQEIVYMKDKQEIRYVIEEYNNRRYIQKKMRYGELLSQGTKSEFIDD